MRQVEHFDGVTVCLNESAQTPSFVIGGYTAPLHISKGGIWLSRRMSEAERKRVMALGLQPRYLHGRIGVRLGECDTTVIYLNAFCSPNEAQEALDTLAQEIARITCMTFISRELGTWRELTKVLTPPMSHWECVDLRQWLSNRGLIPFLGFFGSRARQYAS